MRRDTNESAAPDVLIVGGGVVGLACAWTLAEMGKSVTLLERDQPGAGASGAAAGMLAPYAEIEFHEHDLLTFGERSQELWPEFAKELEEKSGVDVELDKTGTLLLALDRDSRRKLRRDFDYMLERGARATWLPGDECLDLEPLVTPRVVAAVHSPGDIQVSNRQTVLALQAAARNAGVEILCGAEVESLRVSAGECSGARLVDGLEIKASQTLVCAGAWSATITEGSGFVTPVRPVKGQMFSLGVKDGPGPSFVLRGPDAYLVPKRDNTMVLGGTQEEMGWDRDITVRGAYHLLRGAWEMLPATLEYPIRDSWVGFRPGSHDNCPLLGETSIEGLAMATGHFRNGIQQLPATRAAMSHFFSTGKLPLWAAPFDAQRFV